MKDNQRKIGAILSYVSIVANTLVQLLYTPFLISKLGKGEYGLYSLVSSIIGYLTVLDLGFGNAIVVHTAKYRATGNTESEKKLHGMFHLIYIGIGIIAGIIGAVFALNSSAFFANTMTTNELSKMRIMLLILSFNLFITFAFSIYNSIITASEKFLFQKTLAIINTIAKPLLMMPLLFLGYKSIALCVVISVVNVCVLLSNYIFCKKRLNIAIKFSGFDKKLFKVIFAYSFWIFLTQIVDKINWSADQFILGAVSGAETVSVYSAAATLNVMYINLSTAISNVMLPKMSKMVAKKATKQELSSEFIKVSRIQFIVIFLIASGLTLFGKDFISLWLGEGFEEAYYVALLLILPATISLTQNTGLAIMQAMNKFKFKALTTFIMSIANIVMSIFLAKAYGASGAAFGTCISVIICNIIIMNIYYAKVIKLDILGYWKNISIMIVKYLIPIISTLGIIHLFKLEGLKAFLFYGAIYVALYIIVTYTLVADNYEKGMIQKLVNKITKRN